MSCPKSRGLKLGFRTADASRLLEAGGSERHTSIQPIRRAKSGEVAAQHSLPPGTILGYATRSDVQQVPEEALRLFEDRITDRSANVEQSIGAHGTDVITQ